MPIIDELLEELAGASWFSKLDLRAGYHQIRLAEGTKHRVMAEIHEHKTTFQMHNGHFERRVMAFGLSGAPATFNSAMHVTLKVCLRRYVIVFFDD